MVSNDSMKANLTAKLDKLSKPWRPPSMLDIFKKEPGFRYKWCREDIIEKRVAEGWIIVRGNKTEEAPHNLSLDSTIKHRGLILCKMPIEVAKSRNAYYESLANSAIGNQADSMQSAILKSGAQPYIPNGNVVKEEEVITNG